MSGEDEDRPAPLRIGPDPWRELSRLTPARIALGRSGASLPTAEVLRFGLAHAQARDAVHLPADFDAIEDDLRAFGWDAVRVASRAGSRGDYLRRPDLGRRLSQESADTLRGRVGPVDIALVIGDGLSATALHENIAGFLAALKPSLDRFGVTLVCLATNARVALGDEIGELLRARATIILIGERPGLSSPDSLGAYLTLDPRIGRSDADRNCISNIRSAGLSHDEAAHKVAWLLAQALERGFSGVRLKDESDNGARLL